MEKAPQGVRTAFGEKKFPRHGVLGIIIVLAAEVLLFARIGVVGYYFTPLVWTGYILFVDALNARYRGTSLMTDRKREFLFMVPWSVLCWLVFEAYNLYMRNWTYVGLPTDTFARFIGYFWSFATIFPAILETAELAGGLFLSRYRPPVKLSQQILPFLIFSGLACLIIPLLLEPGVSSKLFALVWLGFFLLLEPINYKSHVKSILRDVELGKYSMFIGLLISGIVCGVLWEFWNYWATAKWVYNVPISFAGPKLFEMPLLGYLGFIPFAFECYAMQQFLCILIPTISNRSPALA